MELAIAVTTNVYISPKKGSQKMNKSAHVCIKFTIVSRDVIAEMISKPK
jgi:hypothetical protein